MFATLATHTPRNSRVTGGGAARETNGAPVEGAEEAAPDGEVTGGVGVVATGGADGGPVAGAGAGAGAVAGTGALGGDAGTSGRPHAASNDKHSGRLRTVEESLFTPAPSP